MYGQNLTKFCIHIIIDKIYVGIVNHHFSQICNRVTALDWRQNSVFFLNILRMSGQNLTKFCIHMIIDKIYVGIVNHHFSQICNRVTALDCRQNSVVVFFNIMRMNGQNLTKFCIHMIIDKIYVGIVNRHFSQICNRVTALDWRKNSVFVQYLDIEWTEFNQILYTHYHWQDLRWYCKSSFFANLQQSYGPWLTQEFSFCSISWECMDRI